MKKHIALFGIVAISVSIWRSGIRGVESPTDKPMSEVTQQTLSSQMPSEQKQLAGASTAFKRLIKDSPLKDALAAKVLEQTVVVLPRKNPLYHKSVKKVLAAAKILPAGGPTIHTVAFNRDGTKIASGSSDKTISLWNVTTGALERTIWGHTGAVLSVAFSPNGTKLASGSFDTTTRIWNVATGAQEQILQAHPIIVRRVMQGHIDIVRSVAFSPDGTKLASESDNTIQIWNVATGALERELRGHSRYVSSVTFSPDGTKLASGSQDNTVRIWNVVTGAQERALNAPDVSSVAFSPDGTRLASGSRDNTTFNTIRIWNVATGTLERELQEQPHHVASVAFSPDGTKLASGSDDNTIHIWNVATGAQEQELRGHDNSVTSVAFSPDGTKLASGSHDNTVHIWNLKEIEQIDAWFAKSDNLPTSFRFRDTFSVINYGVVYTMLQGIGDAIKNNTTYIATPQELAYLNHVIFKKWPAMPALPKIAIDIIKKHVALKTKENKS